MVYLLAWWDLSICLTLYVKVPADQGKGSRMQGGNAAHARASQQETQVFPRERAWEQFLLWMGYSGISPHLQECARMGTCAWLAALAMPVPASRGLIPSRGSPGSRLRVSGASLSHFSPVQTADTRATRSAAASSSWTAAGRARARASSRPRAPSCRPAARYAGEGAPGGAGGTTALW